MSEIWNGIFYGKSTQPKPFSSAGGRIIEKLPRIPPLRVPIKYTIVYDEGTPDQQYITRYTDTIAAKIFIKFIKLGRKLPGQAQRVKNPVKMEKTGPNTYKYPEGYVLLRFDKQWGFRFETYAYKFILMSPNYIHRWFIDWYGGEHGRTLIKEKYKR